MAEDIAFLPATKLLERYRARQLSPIEVVAETLRRLERYEGAVNAFVLYDPESAVAEARASEARWQKGAPKGVLDGIPVAIKDTQLTRGWPRRVGSKTIDPNQPWIEDAPSTARLRAEGAVFFGKTTTPEFGWKPVTDSPLTGVTRNPWDLARTPGGSSGGSAVAVLSGICPLAVGTDAGGSIRIPAAFSGVFGLKPTFGKVAVYPPSAFGDVAHAGPMSRTVEDAALMLDAMKGPDPRDWYSLPDDGIAYRERVRERSMRGKRIALSPTLGYHEPAPAVREAVERAGRVFAEQGAIVEPADPFSESPWPVFEVLAGAGMWALLRSMTPEKIAVMDPGLVALCRSGEAITQQQYVDAIGKRVALGMALNHFFERYDLILSPTMPIPAAYAEPRSDGTPDPINYRDWLSYTWVFNLTKNPSASVPCGFADGLPIGLMVTGPLYDDLSVLQACRAYEEAAGRAWPSPDLTAALTKAEGAADEKVKAKILPIR
ncbi:MAG TPA: amidase [Stellaceae bacterium]|jgi:aspartyl-tRNA(Asn)/glutamyl-tRNA(Gln) amidotransferase subunit A|nr:amidase [Stellaceae bacterium]